MVPDRITVEKDRKLLAEIGWYRMTELDDERFEITLGEITMSPETGPVTEWSDFEIIAVIGHQMIMYGSCEWKRISETGSLGAMVPNSMVVVARNRIETEINDPSSPDKQTVPEGDQLRWHSSSNLNQVIG